MENQREVDLFPEVKPIEKALHTKKLEIVGSARSFLDPVTEELKHSRILSPQQAVRYGGEEEIGSFTKIDLSDKESLKVVESVLKKEKDPNTFYFYKGDTIYVDDHLGGTIMQDFITGIKRINPKTQEPIKIGKRLSYRSCDDFSLWWNTKEYHYLKGRIITGDPKTTHKQPPKGK